MSIDTGRTELTFDGRASHAGTPCPSNVSDPMALATALAPKPNFTKSRRPRLCRSVLFMTHSLKVTTVYYSSLDGRNAFCYVLTQQQRFEMKTQATILALLFMCAPAYAQWTKVPAAKIPRGADGKLNLAGPAPQSSDGH